MVCATLQSSAFKRGSGTASRGSRPSRRDLHRAPRQTPARCENRLLGPSGRGDDRWRMSLAGSVTLGGRRPPRTHTQGCPGPGGSLPRREALSDAPVRAGGTTTAQRALQPQFVLGTRRPPPGRARRQDGRETAGPPPPLVTTCHGHGVERRDEEVAEVDAVLDQRLEVVVFQHVGGVEGSPWWRGDRDAVFTPHHVACW